MRSILFSLISTILFISSCTTQMYVSNAENVPAFKEKGEVQLAITKNDFQAAAALSSRVAFMANGYYQKFSDNNRYLHGGLMGEAGLGFYNAINRRITFETFVGAGAGQVYKQQEIMSNNEQVLLAKFKANATRLFLQPDLGYRGKFFDAIVSSRFSFVKYNNFTSENYSQQLLAEDYLDNNNLTSPLFIFAEPALTFRLGYKYLKFQAQYGLTVNVTGNSIRHNGNFSSLGILINIAKWYNGIPPSTQR